MGFVITQNKVFNVAINEFFMPHKNDFSLSQKNYFVMSQKMSSFKVTKNRCSQVAKIGLFWCRNKWVLAVVKNGSLMPQKIARNYSFIHRCNIYWFIDLLDKLILNAITTKCDVTSIFGNLHKTARNQGFTNQILESRPSTLTTDNKLEIKYEN